MCWKHGGLRFRQIGIEVWVSTGAGDEASWREEFMFWRGACVTHLTLDS